MKVLYAEDERQLSMAVTEILKLEGYEVDSVYDGREALDMLTANYYDAAILDIMMPKMDGMEVLKSLRQSENYVPVLMLTAKSAIDDRIDGLSLGADDYLSKPFAMKELIARLNSMVRRTISYKHKVLKYSNITLDCDTSELKTDSGSLRLSTKESELLTLFIKQNTPFSAEKINELLWNKEKNESTVVLYISYLRNKLTQIHSNVNIFQNDEGYVMEDTD